MNDMHEALKTFIPIALFLIVIAAALVIGHRVEGRERHARDKRHKAAKLAAVLSNIRKEDEK